MGHIRNALVSTLLAYVLKITPHYTNPL